ncbi:MAG: hypothetical protein R3E79_01230 [Caldilineaceae bacterium]
MDDSTPASSGITSGIISLGDGEPTGETPTAVSIPGDDDRSTPMKIQSDHRLYSDSRQTDGIGQ